MNNEFIDPLYINIVLSYVQFETIHAYKDRNGRLERSFILVQLAMLDYEKNYIIYVRNIRII